MDAVLQQCFSPVPGVDVLGLFKGLVFTKIHNRTPISAAVSAGCDAQLISLDSQDFPSLYFPAKPPIRAGYTSTCPAQAFRIGINPALAKQRVCVSCEFGLCFHFIFPGHGSKH